MPKFKTYQYLLCLIDINSRKSFLYLLKNRSMPEIITKFNIFLNDIKNLNKSVVSITGDNEFNKINFNK